MDLMTLEISEDEAKERLAEYEAALRIERNVEDEAIAAGYRAAARGLPVFSMRRAIEVGGWFNTGLPRIAVCRADATQCWVSVRGGGWGHGSGDSQVVYGATQFTDNRGALVGKNTVRVMAAGREGRDQWRGSTVVPLVPPRHRPKRHRLSRCHILWEVESWTPEPPVDPALIRHIRGDLWSVLAVWDLTELERMVLSQRSQ